jgi:hypothetical protein
LTDFGGEHGIKVERPWMIRMDLNGVIYIVNNKNGWQQSSEIKIFVPSNETKYERNSET